MDYDCGSVSCVVGFGIGWDGYWSAVAVAVAVTVAAAVECSIVVTLTAWPWGFSPGDVVVSSWMVVMEVSVSTLLSSFVSVSVSVPVPILVVTLTLHRKLAGEAERQDI